MISYELKKKLSDEGHWIYELEDGKVNIVSEIAITKATYTFKFPHEHKEKKEVDNR